MPGYVSSKNAVRDKDRNTFVATAYFPTPQKAYSGNSLDGFWIHDQIDEDLFGSYLRLATEAEKLGFTSSKIWPKKGQCMQGVCVHPWQMYEEEVLDFSRMMMKKAETEELIISDSAYGDAKRGGREKAYEFRAKISPTTNNVEVSLVGSPGQVGPISGIVGKSLDLLGVELRKDDKVSYMNFYQEENKTAEAVLDAFATAGGAISGGFSKIGSGFKYIGHSTHNAWRSYQDKRHRKSREILQEVLSYGLEPNARRTQSCLYAWNKACIVENIEKKKAEAPQTAQSN
jgi:hypothetical protein